MKGKDWESLVDVVAQGERDYNAGVGFHKGENEYQGLKRRAWRHGWLAAWWKDLDAEFGD